MTHGLIDPSQYYSFKSPQVINLTINKHAKTIVTDLNVIKHNVRTYKRTHSTKLSEYTSTIKINTSILYAQLSAVGPFIHANIVS